jgi:hypothetical protein
MKPKKQSEGKNQKPYSSPRLRKYGDLRHLTGAKSGTGVDPAPPPATKFGGG